MFNNGFQAPALKRGSEKTKKKHTEKEKHGLFTATCKRKPRQAGKTEGRKKKRKEF